ncbi:hypothetical protein chiPu_0031847, partial [Chiloscyllium punctatum]|nr:hypothetical protein [Chiloscyllium punctatum]
MGPALRRDDADFVTQRSTSRWVTRLHHDDLGADIDATVEIDHVLVAHPDAAGRDVGADRPGLVGAVDAIERRAEIHRARP